MCANLLVGPLRRVQHFPGPTTTQLSTAKDAAVTQLSTAKDAAVTIDSCETPE